MKLFRTFFVVLTLVFIRGCTKNHIERIVFDNMQSNFFIYFNDNGLKTMKEDNVYSYHQLIHTPELEIYFDVNFANNTLVAGLFARGSVEQYFKDNGIKGCSSETYWTVCKYAGEDNTDPYIKSLFEKMPLLFQTLDFSENYLSTLKHPKPEHEENEYEGSGVDAYSLRYENINPETDPNGKRASGYVGKELTLLTIWFARNYGPTHNDYTNYNICYGDPEVGKPSYYLEVNIRKE